MIKRVYIEILNFCNLSCAFCRKNSRPARIMSPQEFRHVLQEVRGITHYIYLHVQGEPLMHPQLEEILSLCDLYGMRVHLVTNGTLLDRRPHLYSHPSVRKICISLQSIEYQPASSEACIASLLPVIDEAASLPGRILELRFWREDQMDLSKTKAILSALKQHFPFAESGRRNQYALGQDVYIAFANSFEWPKTSGEKGAVRGTCLGARTQIAVLSDGRVVPCCLDCDGEITLGNVFDTPLAEILQSPRYRTLAEDFQNGTVREPLCISCGYRHRFDR